MISATQNRHPAGFGLVELIVALTILSIGMLALTGAASVAQRSFIGARALQEGTDAAAALLDSLMSETSPVAGTRRVGRADAQWSIGRDSVATNILLTIRVNDGASIRRLDFHASHRAR
ncbi:MAG TPA: prepilin-type N-terminal cleavage/methylation domain-containing protein [Longimicrobiales bacterium]|nr:prepilin-type N-terminal cleavage/methylation domain-containing protein [Longimicrobiales bacterium]